MIENRDETTLDALGTARVVLYGVQFEKGPLASRLTDTVNRITQRGRVGRQSPESVVRNLRNAVAFEGSLKEQIGFIDRPEDEIRSFLNGVAAGVEMETSAFAGGSEAPPTASRDQAGTV